MDEAYGPKNKVSRQIILHFLAVKVHSVLLKDSNLNL